MRTSSRLDRNLTQAFRTLLARRARRRITAMHPRNQSIHRGYHKEVHGRGNQEESHGGINKISDREFTAMHGEFDRGKIRLADQSGNQRREQVFGEGRNHRGESRTDHDADRHIHNITAKDELLESAEHSHSCLQIWTAEL